MRRIPNQIQEQMEAAAVKRHIGELAMLCLSMNADFEVSHSTHTVSIRDIGMDKSSYIKVLADNEKPYMQSGKLLTLDEIRNMVATITPTSRMLQPAYAYNYAED